MHNERINKTKKCQHKSANIDINLLERSVKIIRGEIKPFINNVDFGGCRKIDRVSVNNRKTESALKALGIYTKI